MNFKIIYIMKIKKKKKKKKKNFKKKNGWSKCIY